MNKIEMPLYSFFENLRHQKVPLGIEEYMLLLEVLMHQVQHNNLGYFDKDAMYNLCKLLWFKPTQKEVNFKNLFNKHWKQVTFRKEDFLSKKHKAKTTNENNDPEDASNKKTGHQDEIKPASEKEPAIEQKNEDASNENNEKEQNIYIDISEVKNQEQKEAKVAKRNFYFEKNYVPFQKRNIGQIWRFLQKNNYLGASQEIDVPQTVKHLSKTGVLQKVFFKPYESNAMQMITLIDYRGGMTAFKNLALELAQSAKISAGIDNKIFFFQKVPHILKTESKKGYCIYTKEDETEFDILENVLSKMKKHPPILIISDAGAVANYYDAERIEKTKDFLENLKTYTQKIVWLNPMPADRRIDNSAEIIEEYVNTFEANLEGLKQAIKILKGKKIT